ncbi:MAG: amidohydrolase family protein [Spirochaetales bacterium]|jgi:allantoinase
MLIAKALAALPGEKDFRKVDILVKNGKIAAITEAGSQTDDEVLDAEGLMLFPGAIDPHVHFDEPGFTHREDFLHGTSEAARGGVTTVIDMPCTSLPPITSLAALENKLSIVSKSAIIDFAFFGGVSGLLNDASMQEEITELSPKVVGFKCYFISGMDTFTAVTPAQFARAIERCAAAGRPLLLHAEDSGVIAAAQTALATARGDAAPTWKDYYASRPMEAEKAACAAAVALAGTNSAWLHVVHVGTAEAAENVAASGASCETCAHYLAFDEDDFETLGAALKTAPPVKEASQKALLWRMLSEGIVSFVTSDHAGAPDYEKFTGNPLTAYGGIPGTGTLFPYLLSEGLFAKRLSLPRFLEATSGAAATRYGLSGGKGSLSVGKDADFALVDPEASTLMTSSTMLSKSTITPFAGMRLAGRIAGTFVRGTCAFGTTRLVAKGAPATLAKALNSRDEKILALPGSGKFIKWGYR